MPNGGTNNCASCHFNKAAKELGNKFIDQPEERRKLFEQLCYCTLRDVKITIPRWTYCANYFYYLDKRSSPEDEQPKGWIKACGISDGYARIPWDDKNEPMVGIFVICSICGRFTDEGIEIDHNGEILDFCNNRHYIEWWLTCL